MVLFYPNLTIFYKSDVKYSLFENNFFLSFFDQNSNLTVQQNYNSNNSILCETQRIQ